MKIPKHIMKIVGLDLFIIEFGPVVVFFLAFYLSDFPRAALALALATLATLFLSQIVNKRIPWFALFSGIVTIITSLLTYIYDAPWVLIVKDTVYYYLFGGLLAYSMWRSVGIFEIFFGHIFAITKEAWLILERRWMIFFFIVGTINELVRLFLTTESWVIYKQIVLIAFFVFGTYQFRVSARYRLPEADRFGLRRKR